MDYHDFIHTVRAPLAIVSELPASWREQVLAFLLAQNIPTYFEATSGLREEPRLSKLRVETLGNRWWDGVLRIGGVPTTRKWRDLETLQGDVLVYSVSHRPFSGLSWAGVVGHLPEPIQRSFPFPKKESKLSAEHYMHHLSKKIPEEALVYLGNSLTIREWDCHATFEPRQLDVYASRGLNGIDGQVATFLGLASSKQSNWAILGDLTTMYDFSGFWILDQLDVKDLTIVVINNRGGKIFEGMFSEEKLQNKHTHHFSHIASHWGMDYILWEGSVGACTKKSVPTLIELSINT